MHKDPPDERPPRRQTVPIGDQTMLHDLGPDGEPQVPVVVSGESEILPRWNTQRIDLVEQVADQRIQPEELRMVLADASPEERENFTIRLAKTLNRNTMILAAVRELSTMEGRARRMTHLEKVLAKLLGTERCTLFLFDKKGSRLWHYVPHGEGFEQLYTPLEHSIVGSVFTSNRGMIIADVFTDPRFDPKEDRRQGLNTRNLLCVPFCDRNDDPIGVAQVANKKGKSFTTEDLELLQRLCVHSVLTAVQETYGPAPDGQEITQVHEIRANQEITEEITEEITQVQRVQEDATPLEAAAEILQELRFEPLVKKIATVVQNLLDCEHCLVFLYDRRGDELWCRVSAEVHVGDLRIAANSGIPGAVFQSLQYTNVEDAYADPRFNSELDHKMGIKTRSVLCVPMVNAQNKTVGVLYALNPKQGVFQLQEERRLKTFAQRAAVAISNAFSFEENSRARSNSESIFQNLLTAILCVDASGVVRTANRAAIRILGAGSGDEGFIGKTVSEVFSAANEWVETLLQTMERSGHVQTYVDRQLRVAVVENGEQRDGAPVSVKACALPLKNREGQPQGCLLTLDVIDDAQRAQWVLGRSMPMNTAIEFLGTHQDQLPKGIVSDAASVLTARIRSYSSLLARSDLQKTLHQLSVHFEAMEEIVIEQGGILESRVGDGLRVVFGALAAQEDNADRCVQAAVRMLHTLRKGNVIRQNDGFEPLLVSIGVHTGSVISGWVGGSRHASYSVTGEAMDTALRLEEANKAYGTELLLSEATKRKLSEHHVLREVDKFRLKGQSEAITVYEVLDHHDADSFAHLEDVLNLFNMGLAHYRRQEWAPAEDFFKKASLLNPKDSVSRLYFERARYLNAHPPPRHWNGVWAMAVS